MPRPLYFPALLLIVMPLAGCGFGDALGLNKRAPDEFAVVRRQPLVVPPDFDLRPPRPGAVRPQTGSSAEQARATLTGREAGADALTSPSGSSGTSAGQSALLARTARPDPGPGVAPRETGAEADADLRERLLAQPPDASTEEGADASSGAPVVVRREQTRLDEIEETPR